MMVSSGTRLGGRLPVLRLKRMCCQKHPGLCLTRHAEVASLVLRVCCNLNTLFTGLSKWSAIGRVLRFTLRTRGAVIGNDY